MFKTQWVRMYYFPQNARSIVRACFPRETRLTTDPKKLEESFRSAIHGKLVFFIIF